MFEDAIDWATFWNCKYGGQDEALWEMLSRAENHVGDASQEYF